MTPSFHRRYWVTRDATSDLICNGFDNWVWNDLIAKKKKKREKKTTFRNSTLERFRVMAWQYTARTFNSNRLRHDACTTIDRSTFDPNSGILALAYVKPSFWFTFTVRDFVICFKSWHRIDVIVVRDGPSKCWNSGYVIRVTSRVRSPLNTSVCKFRCTIDPPSHLAVAKRAIILC